LREAGARVVTAGYLESGLYTTVHPDLSAAVVDLHLGDGSGTMICRELQRLGVLSFTPASGVDAARIFAAEYPRSVPCSASRPTRRGCSELALSGQKRTDEPAED